MNRDGNQSRLTPLRSDRFVYRAAETWPVPGPGLGKRRRMDSRTSLSLEKAYNMDEFLEPGITSVTRLQNARLEVDRRQRQTGRFAQGGSIRGRRRNHEHNEGMQAGREGTYVITRGPLQIEGQRHHHIMYTGLDQLDAYGRSPLMYAVLSESLACMEVLLEFGALREQVWEKL